MVEKYTDMEALKAAARGDFVPAATNEANWLLENGGEKWQMLLQAAQEAGVPLDEVVGDRYGSSTGYGYWTDAAPYALLAKILTNAELTPGGLNDPNNVWLDLYDLTEGVGMWRSTGGPETDKRRARTIEIARRLFPTHFDSDGGLKNTIEI